ncbi:MAG TPA: S1-like domain-containing RNA-binding protein [Flavobacterium sp.]|uniref:CvfB family protein n=1 Tax=Flavobacterium sp. TaxID=239 RepID=UPI002C614F50|nr:S1-like domain-containing RNA-binding protein [Flavobacterium sp.]MCA0347970.1 GntR family transcriptional regulator [Bacteroidota bacterium]HPW96966.1 S1-like domain-containing RNA-binding protein [Flavobacterium sp.]HQA74952.1 S1-like domain-containing RNA-binding protein [Flavobacterium sp.]
MKLGEFNTLIIDRLTKVGLFLTDNTNDVLLPLKYIPKDYKIGDEIKVFLYLDHEERPVATTLEPYIIINDFAFLRVNYTNSFGAFLDWGLEKDLFVPFKEQARPMEQGKRYLVHAYLDDKSDRIVGSSRVNKFLDNSELDLQQGDEVDLIISHITDLGTNVIINKKHKGLMYSNEIYEDLRIGDKHKGYIKTIRPDNKIDVSFQKIGVENIEPNAEVILKELKANRGFLRLNDNSHPEDIKTVLKMSKKSFKKAVGSLYKDKIIEIKEDGIYLV